MKECVTDFGLKVLNEEMVLGTLLGISRFEISGHNLEVNFSFDPSSNVVRSSIRYAGVPIEKSHAMYELLNSMNLRMATAHFSIEPNLRMIILDTGHYVTGYFLNRGEFKTLFGDLLATAHIFYPLIWKLIQTDQTPESIMKEFYDFFGTALPGIMGQSGKYTAVQATEERPFVLHGSADLLGFPTHTHGMTALGLPELLIDHLAFGPEPNSKLLVASYQYFTKPENAGKLDAIKNGETVKLRDPDLKPPSDHPDPHVYCYRRVYPEFEMVKQAYNVDKEKGLSDVPPEAWFVQIYIEGDDFALTDEYYRGGIKW